MRYRTKDYSRANRGMNLEKLIRISNEWYRRNGIAFIEKIPTEFIPLRDMYGRVYDVKVAHKASVDFIGRLYEHPIMVEAKHTGSGNIRFDAVQENQAKDLDEFTGGGGLGVVVVSFEFKRFFAVPWPYWGVAYDVRIRQKRRTDELVIGGWQVPKKLSFNADDLLPGWEVFMKRDHLDYLEGAYVKEV